MTLPKYIITNANSLPWQKMEEFAGVEIKSLGTANGQTMELYRFAANRVDFGSRTICSVNL